MDKKIVIEVCTGTTCFLMGSSEIILIKDHLSPELQEMVEVKGSVCLDHCKNITDEKAPFVEINGKYISNASLPKVISYIEKLSTEI